MAYLKQRRNKWFAVWREKGKKIIKTTGIDVKGKKEEKLAKATADAMELAAKNSHMVMAALDAVRTSAVAAGFGEAMPSISEYLSSFQPGGQHQNISNAKRAYSLFLEHLGTDGAKRMDALTPSMCKSFFQAQMRRVSFGTASHYLKHLRAAFNTAVQDRIIDRSPFAAVNLGQMLPASEQRKKQRLPFTPNEMSYLLTKLPRTWRDLCLLSFSTGGQRVGDCCCLLWSSVDFDTDTVTFNTMKTGRHITAPMVPHLRAMLKARYVEGEKYVFPDLARLYMRGSGHVSVEFTALLRAAGIIKEKEGVVSGDRRRMAEKSFHSIRHTVVSMLRSSTLFTPDLARAIVGHDSEAIEREYFTASDADKKNGLMYLMAEVQKGGAPNGAPPCLPNAD